MQHLDNKVKLPELSGLDRVSITPREKTYSAILVLAFCIFVVVVLVVGILVNSYLDGFTSGKGPNGSDLPTLENANWKVRNVSASNGTEGVKLELKSSVGNLRTYEGVKAYGISSTGKYLALTSSRGLEVVNLAENSTQAINTPFDITGDEGEIISWSFDDGYFAIPVFNNEDDTPHLLVFSRNGTSVEDIGTDLAYKRDGSKITMYPVLFSPQQNQILVRNFDETDTTVSNTSDKPVLLTVLDLKGKNLWEHEARGTSSDTEVLYYWSADGKCVFFAVIPDNTVINYANKNLFTKVSFEPTN